MSLNISKEWPALVFDPCLGVVGFLLSVGWGRVSGGEMDRDAVIFLAKLWGGIALFGIVLVCIM